MDNLEFYKGLYDKEVDRKNAIYNQVNLPLAVATLNSGLMYLLIQNCNENSDFFSILYIVLIGLSVLLLLIGCFFLIKTVLFKGVYKEFPKTKELRGYQTQLEEYDSSQSKKDVNSFDNYTIEKYVEYADSYVQLNDKRSSSLYSSILFLVLSLVLLFLPIIIFLIKTISK